MSKEVTVSQLPECDFHKQRGVSVPGLYDAKTDFGPWANMCENCMRLYGPWDDSTGTPRLGTGVGQRLVLG